MRNYLNILFLTCFCVSGFFTQGVAQQAMIRTASVNFNGGTNIVYANTTVPITTNNVNMGTIDIPVGDDMGIMISVDGDAPTLVANEILSKAIIPYGTFPTNLNTQDVSVVIENANYVFNPARFSGGGGLVHDIIIWPTKLGGSNLPVGTYDTARFQVLYIDAAAFRVTNSSVLGLNGVLNLETIYPQINAIAENVGLSANTNDLEFFIQLDDFSPRLLGATSNSVSPGNQYGMVVPNFRIRDFYPVLPIGQAFRASTHLLKVYAQEQNQVNRVGIAEFMVDASNSFPVELLGFDGYMNNHKIHLNWASSNERNNSHFIVQKYLHDQEVYTNIGRVEGVGFADTINYYNLTDPEPGVGINTYRLIQVDMDGLAVVTGETLEIFYQLENKELEMVQAYPNPFKNATNLKLRVPEAGNLRIEIYDVMGKRVWLDSKAVHAGMNEVNLNLASHRSGTYLYRMNLNGEVISGKLIKQ